MSKQRNHSPLSKAQFDAMAEEATVDCYNESEQATGWFTMIEENLKLPFETKILGMPVTVERVDINPNDEIVVICRRGKHRQTLPIVGLSLPLPLPAGAQWIEAYRQWTNGERS